MRAVIFMIFVFLLIANLAVAQCFKEKTDNISLAEKSDLVVNGKLISMHSFWNDKHNFIYTAYKLEISTLITGYEPQQAVDLIIEGGSIDELTMTLFPNADLKIGDEGTFYLVTHPDRHNSYKLASLFDGFETKVGTEYANKTSNLADSIYFLPKVISAGLADTFYLYGSGFDTAQFSSYVSFFDGDRTDSSWIDAVSSVWYHSWTDTLIKMIIPASDGLVAGSGLVKLTINDSTEVVSDEFLSIPFARRIKVIPGNTLLRPDMAATNGNGGYTFEMNVDYGDDAKVVARTRDAVEQWSCKTGVNWDLSNTNTGVDQTAFDGKNIIRWDNGDELADGLLGQVIYITGSCTNGITEDYVAEIDIRLDDSRDWFTENDESLIQPDQFDLYTVLLHEMGHALQLKHCRDKHHVMYPNVLVGSVNRRIRNADQAGGRLVVEQSSVFNFCGEVAMDSIPYNQCAYQRPEAAALCYFEENDTGFTGYFVDISEHGPTSWNWIFYDVNNDTVINQKTVSRYYGSSGSYDLRLEVCNSFGCDTMEKTISTDLINGIKDEQFGFQFFPNPLTDVLHLQGAEDNDLLVVLDMNGKQVSSYRLNRGNNQTNLAALTKGNYLLFLVRNGSLIQHSKLLKE